MPSCERIGRPTPERRSSEAIATDIDAISFKERMARIVNMP
jgi:hypothetical protein